MPEKESTLEKVRKLINLASSANQKEAERAAFKACALIRTYGLDVCDPDEIDGIFRKLADAESQVKQLAAKTATDDEDDGYTIFPPRVYTGGGGTVVGGGGGQFGLQQQHDQRGGSADGGQRRGQPGAEADDGAHQNQRPVRRAVQAVSEAVRRERRDSLAEGRGHVVPLVELLSPLAGRPRRRPGLQPIGED
jgi:hypothetical protein